MTPLTRLPRGARAVISELPKPHVLAKRLCALGLTPGSEVCVLQNRGSGPMIVEVHGARLALGRRQADRVTVELFGGSGCTEGPDVESPAAESPAADAPALDAPAEG